MQVTVRRPLQAAVAGLACALFSFEISSAQAIKSNPDPGLSGEGYVDYVGHFGEVFKLRGGGIIDAKMAGKMEVINLYPAWRFIDGDPVRFKPKSSDFDPKNFSRLELIQLLIIPRASEAFGGIPELKRAKVKDLEESGVKYKIRDRPHFPAFRGDWPEETFEIVVEQPYKLIQLYTATTSYLCILTAGYDTPPATEIGHYYHPLRYGLATWLVPQQKLARDESPAAITAAGISLHPFAVPAVWATWCLVSGIAALLVALLWRRRRDSIVCRTSQSVLILSHAGAVIGGLVGLVLWPISWISHHLPVPGMIAVLFMPVGMRFLERLLGEKLQRPAWAGVCLWAAGAAAFLGYSSWADWDPGSNSRYVVPFNLMIGFVAYAVGGLIAGVLGEARKTAKMVLSGLFAFGISTEVRAGSAVASVDAEMRRIAMQKRLEAKGITEAIFRRQAKQELSKTRVLYDQQRVEMKGIWSPNSRANDTNNGRGPLFDLQISPTAVGAGEAPWLKNAVGAVKDLKDLHKDAYNELSNAASTAVLELAGKEVNEIVAHSWGTEIVYNAILAGVIRPPRRLIVAGMPDSDLAKWAALSKYTGTEVVVHDNSLDPVAGAARAAVFGARAATNSAAAEAVSRPLSDALKFEQQWKKSCTDRKEGEACNRHNRSGVAVIRTDFKMRSHDRFEYYQAMEDAGDLPASPVENRVFISNHAYPGSAASLRAEQEALIDGEVRRLYDAYVDQQLLKVDAETTRARGELDFLSTYDKETALVESVRQAALDHDVRQKEKSHQDLIDMGAAAKSCGYTPIFENNRMVGFSEDGRYRSEFLFNTRIEKAPISYRDLRSMFVVFNACRRFGETKESVVSKPGACNDAAGELRGLSGLQDKFRAVNPPYMQYVNSGPQPCIDKIIKSAKKIRNTEDFVSILEDIQEDWNDNAEDIREGEAHRAWMKRKKELDEAELRRSARDRERERTSPDHDEVWDRVNKVIGK